MAILIEKCPHCGANLIFNSVTKGYHCEYCNSNFSSEQVSSSNPNKTSPPHLQVKKEFFSSSNKGDGDIQEMADALFANMDNLFENFDTMQEKVFSKEKIVKETSSVKEEFNVKRESTTTKKEPNVKKRKKWRW